MSPRDLVYVSHMLDMARKAVAKSQGLSRESYDGHPEIRWADLRRDASQGRARSHPSKPFRSNRNDDDHQRGQSDKAKKESVTEAGG